MTAHIRPARPSDVPRIHALVARAYAHYVPRIGARPRPMDTDHTDAVAAGQVWAAARGAEVVGAIVLVPEPGVLLVENLAVEPACQGRGLGGELLEFAEREAARRGLPRLRLFTHVLMHENRAFYARKGFREVQQRVEDGRRRVFMVKLVARAS